MTWILSVSNDDALDCLLVAYSDTVVCDKVVEDKSWLISVEECACTDVPIMPPFVSDTSDDSVDLLVSMVKISSDEAKGLVEL